jgi:hypothetical protein
MTSLTEGFTVRTRYRADTFLPPLEPLDSYNAKLSFGTKIVCQNAQIT